MGFDLVGEKDNYFRANIWNWKPLAQLIAETGVLSENQIEGLNFNDGTFISSKQAIKIAEKIEEQIKQHNTPYKWVKLGPEFTNEEPENLQHGISLEHIREFTEFAHASGGFKIW